MIALLAGDNAATLRLTYLHKILACHLQRGFDSFGAAGNKVHILKTGRRFADQVVSQLFHRLGGEK